MNNIALSIITATWKRPAFLLHLLESVRLQSTGNLKWEQIVVSDGVDPVARTICKDTTARYFELPEHRGAYGAFAKDEGIRQAKGEYVCFWDDDNLYEPHAIATLYSATAGFDIGVVRTKHRCSRTGKTVVIPRAWTGTFHFQDIDTMCVCVRTTLAIQTAWGTEQTERGTDYRWLDRLTQTQPMIRYVPIEIGTHC